MGFSKWVAVSGQTYTRKIDYQILRCVLCLLCAFVNRPTARLTDVESPPRPPSPPTLLL